MARSDSTPTIKVEWDRTEKRWVGPGVRGSSLGRVFRIGEEDGVAIEPAGPEVDEIIKARVAARAAQQRFKAEKLRYQRILHEAHHRHGMSKSDVAHLSGTTRQNIDQLLSKEW